MAALARSKLGSAASNPIRVEITAAAAESDTVNTFVALVHGNTQASG